MILTSFEQEPVPGARSCHTPGNTYREDIMKGYFVTLFAHSRVFQYKISDLIRSSVNGYISTSLVPGERRLYLPLEIHESGYTVRSRASHYQILCNGQPLPEEGRALCHGDHLIFQGDNLQYSALVLSCEALSVAHRAYALTGQTLFIGRAAEMDICLDINTAVSRKAAAIRWEETGDRYLEDLSGKTGVYVNGRRVTSHKLCPGDEIYIMGTTMVYYPDKLLLPASVKTSLQPLDSLELLPPSRSEARDPYVRTPRIVKSLEKGQITIDPPPPPMAKKTIPYLLNVGPSLTMSLAMLVSMGVAINNAANGGSTGTLITSVATAASMLLGALLWPSLMRRYNRKQARQYEEYRVSRYTAYLEEKENQIRKKYDRNVRILNETLMPGPDVLRDIAEQQDHRLWERTPKDPDFLTVRLGLGTRKFTVNIDTPPENFTLDEDPLLRKAVELGKKYEVMQNVPVTLSLRDKRTVGVIGDVADIFRLLVANLSTLYAPDEVKLVLVYGEADRKLAQWANELPHVWSNDRKRRYVAANREDANVLFTDLEEEIAAREEGQRQEEPWTPHYVVLVLDESLVEGIPFRRHLVNAGNNVGLSCVFFGRYFHHIPKECTVILQKDAEVCGVYVKNENDNRFVTYTPDSVPEEDLHRIMAGLNRIPFKAERVVSGVPDRVSFLDMYRVGNVADLEILNRWHTNTSEKSLAAPVGIKAGGQVFSLDIHEKHHGCHGLVAGTTGSGKSEFLQAYILSMMIRYSPNEVGFVLVDFKGGDMARPFLKAPHLAATISNLSGNTLHRALISLQAEVRNRQSSFNEAARQLGVDKIDINSYHRYFKEKKLDKPLPHLVIVIDEFAQLKSQHPEFMAKLIDIAQVGRSLGIHLILATQRPSGVVDPQIWSNSRFKVCLKVLDKQDSADMIGRPEAALIKQPGRAYVQVGYDEIFELLQSGYSGAEYVGKRGYTDEDSISISMVSWPAEPIRTAKRPTAEEKTGRSQLEEIVSSIVRLGESENLKVSRLWLPQLPGQLRLEEACGVSPVFDPAAWDQGGYQLVLCGLVDDVEHQRQYPYGVDLLRQGHLAIYGASGTGKTTLIQTLLFTLALRHSPAQLHTFVLDFGGSGLRNVAQLPHCAAYVSGDGAQEAEGVLQTLRQLITERQALFAEHHCANYTSYLESTGKTLPMVLLVLDNYTAFRERAPRCEDLLVQLVAAAKACGIYLIVTGNSKGAIFYKVTEHISSRIVLNMNDSGAYRDILNLPVPVQPDALRGRGLTVLDKQVLEVQIAVPFDAEDEAARRLQIQACYGQMAQAAPRVCYDIPQAQPAAPAAAPAFVPQYQPEQPDQLPALDPGTEALCFGTDLTAQMPKGIVPDPGKRIFLGSRGSKRLLPSLLAHWAPELDRELYVLSSSGADYGDKPRVMEDLDAFVEDLVTWSPERLAGSILFIDGFCDFFDRISDEALDLFENFLKADTHLCVLTADPMERWQDYRDTGLFVHLVRARSGAVAGGRIEDETANSLSAELFEIPRKFRSRELSDTQVTVYEGKRLSYVSLPGAIFASLG